MRQQTDPGIEFVYRNPQIYTPRKVNQLNHAMRLATGVELHAGDKRQAVQEWRQAIQEVLKCSS